MDVSQPAQFHSSIRVLRSSRRLHHLTFYLQFSNGLFVPIRSVLYTITIFCSILFFSPKKSV